MSARLGGRYQIVREIGSGGMGRVYQAVDTETGRPVAAKVLIAGEDIDLKGLLRFQQEGAVLSTLKHPNIVQVYGTHLEEHTSSIIMELLEGSSLGDMLQRERLTRPRIRHIMRQVASALAYAHSRGIVHRDVKPDNIMVVGDDHVKVTDFGIARVLQEGGTLNTQTGTAIGTPLYMSPEQIEGHKLDGRSDIYSFGAVLYQTVTGRPPFDGGDPLTIAFKHVHRAPDPPGEVSGDVPEDWEDLILRCLAKNPNDRPQTAAGLEEEVAALTLSDSAPRGRTTGPDPHVAPPAPEEDEARAQEARERLEAGKSKEMTGEFRSALRAYRTGLTVAPPGPIRDELENAVTRVSARSATPSPDGAAVIADPPLATPPAPAGPASSSSTAPASGPASPRQRSSRGIPRLWLAVGGGAVVVLAIALALIVGRSGGSHNAVGSPTAVPHGSGGGGAPSSMARPDFAAVTSSGALYVSDTGHDRIDNVSASGAVVSQWGASGSGAGQLRRPMGVALDTTGNVYVADAGNNRVQKFSPGGEPLAQWEGPSSARFNDPQAVAVDARGRVYVADTGNNRVVVLTPGGKVAAVWGASESSSVSFDHPAGIAVDPAGGIYVADTGNNQIQKLSSSGQGLGAWGTAGSGAGQFNAPHGLAIDTQGNVYVADTGNNRVQELASTSDPIGQWKSGPAGRFHAPEGVALGPHNRLYVVDTANNRVQHVALMSGSG